MFSDCAWYGEVEGGQAVDGLQWFPKLHFTEGILQQRKNYFDILALSGWATLDSKTSKRALRTLFRYLIIEETWSRQKEEELNCAVWISNCILFFAFWILILGFSISDLAFFILHCVFRIQGCAISLDCFFPLCVFKWPASEDAKSHWFHLFDFSPLCISKCVLKWPAYEDAKSHRLHLFYFSPLCIFKCVLKSPAWEKAKLHCVHLFDFSPLCVLKCLLKWHACE